MSSNKLKGVLSPVVTPFGADGSPAHEPWIEHCRWLLSKECGLAIFGTNSEANSLSIREKRGLLSAAFEAGLDPNRMMPGTGSCALPDAIEMTKAAVEGGAAGVLVLPPFYYKAVDDDGLFAFFDGIVQAVGDPDLRMYLYHIPQVAGVGISMNLIARLKRAHGSTIAGIKDSGGDWEFTRRLIEEHEEFDVFCGSEPFLLQTMRAGGAGCISATANVNPAAIHDLYANWRADDADERQEKVTAFRSSITLPMIPSLKAITARRTGNEVWNAVRPPLLPLSNDERQSLLVDLDQRPL